MSIEFESSEIDEICNACCIDTIIQANQEAYAEDQYNDQQLQMAKEEGWNFSSHNNSIDDLFDRG